MPLYVYEPVAQAEGAGVPSECCSFEALQSLSEPTLAQCPVCGHPVQRALTSVGFFVRGASSSSERTKETKPIFGTSSRGDRNPSENSNASSDSRAGRVARLAANHVCGLGCKH
jgi:putative FmdB family regulatory protein